MRWGISGSSFQPYCVSLNIYVVTVIRSSGLSLGNFCHNTRFFYSSIFRHRTGLRSYIPSKVDIEKPEFESEAFRWWERLEKNQSNICSHSGFTYFATSRCGKTFGWPMFNFPWVFIHILSLNLGVVCIISHGSFWRVSYDFIFGPLASFWGYLMTIS